MQDQKPVLIIPVFLFILIFLTCTPTLVFVQSSSRLPSRCMIHGVPQIHQGRNECGPASMAMVLNYWGINKGKEELKGPLRWDSERGVAPINMIRFAHESGFKFDSPEEGSIEGLMNHIAQNRPVIVRQWLNNDAKHKADMGHYRIVIGYDHDRQEIYMRDPAIANKGSSKLGYKEFVELWDLANHPKVSSKNWMLVLIPEK